MLPFKEICILGENQAGSCRNVKPWPHVRLLLSQVMRLFEKLPYRQIRKNIAHVATFAHAGEATADKIAIKIARNLKLRFHVELSPLFFSKETSLINYPIVTCEKAVVQFDSTKHRRLPRFFPLVTLDL